MIAQKYNYWNEIVTSNNAVVNNLQQTVPNQQYSSFNHLPGSGVTGNLSEPNGGIGGGDSGNYNYVATGDSGGNNMTPPCTNNKCFDYANEYVKDIINRISEKEPEKNYIYDKSSISSDYYDYVSYDSSNPPSNYDQNNNNNLPNGTNMGEYIRHDGGDFKKSNILSKFYKPDGTPLKSLWDTDTLIKEQRSYKYDPKPLERRKNPRAFVPDEKKTNEYWEKRRKNNLAARKSREDRRKKEIEVLKHVNNLKTDNIKLKLYAQKIMSENQNLKYEVEMLRRL